MEEKSPSWFLNRLMIKDLTHDRVYYFMLDKWLAVEEDDGSIERVIPVAGKSELTAFGHLFYSKTRRNLSDAHLWFSVFARPAKSRFTRVQRATCCLSLLFTAMMSNIFFYNVDFVDPSAQQKVFKIGPIGFTMSEVVIGVIASLMVVPINLIIVQIFRITRPAPPSACGCCSKKKRHQDGDAYEARKMTQTPKVDEEDELQRQLDLLEEEEMKQGPIPSVSLEVDNSSRTNSTQSLPRENRNNSTATVDMAPVLGFKKKKKKKRKFELPWGFLIVGWILATLSILVSSWMVIEVAGTFGKQKATEWLTSMMISLIQDILLTQPLKVLVIAVFVSLIFKSPEKEDTDEPPVPHLQNDEEWLHKPLTNEELNDPKKMVDLEIEGVIKDEEEDAIEKPDEDAIEVARVTRFKEMQMTKILKEIVFYIVFLNVTMLITLGERDENAYYINKSLQDMFVSSSYHGKMQFSKILTKDQFWNYTENTFLPTLYDHTLYNGETDILAEEGNIVADLQMYLLGQARLRQVRIEPESCKLHEQVKELMPECRDYFNVFDEQEGNFDEFWIPYNESNPINYEEGFNRAWQYRKASDLNSSALWGRYVVYPGSGYAIELGSSLGEAKAVVSYLRDSLWIDQYTRAVFLEFVMYNANLNMHSASALIVEMQSIGGASPFTFFWTTRLDRYDGSFAIFILAGQLIFGLFIIYFLQHEIRNIIKEKKEYFKNPWNIAELVTIALSISGMGFYAYRYIVGRSLMEDYKEHQPMMIDFHFFAQWDQLYGFMVGFVLFIATIKFMRILRFNRRILIFSMTLRNCSKDMSYYGIVFTIVFMAFACAGYAIYNKDMKDFSTVVRTVETLFSTVLGKFNFSEMKETNRILGPMFFFAYVVLIVFVLLNMFLSIINQSFSKVRHETNAIDGEMEIVDFMMERFKRWTGFSEPRVKTKEKKFLYIEYVDPVDKACDDLRLKLNGMVDELNAHIRKARQEDSDYIYEDNYDYGSSGKKIFLSS
ncbi:LOW QUALITY PROTEIN: polycystin-1-like protein 2 [Amphiura filiformis]|uniref:LOW QUALITY PROTEIN: polycystin-1-like protein 2 n=1 Tax=Amphiura filiformis TaxID=82378 RepID=UPI003B20F858